VHGFSSANGNFGLVVECAAPPPPLSNDACADAMAMMEGVAYTGDNRGSTADGSASCAPGAAPDVWYTFTPSATATAMFSLCDSVFDTALSVHDACPGDGGVEIACNDNACGTRSEVSISAVSGQTYWIRVSGNGDSGQFSLRADLFAPDANDDCAGAIPLIEGSPATGNTNGNTVDGAASCAASTAPDVWYSFTPASDRTARFSLCASTFDTVLSVFSGCPGAGGSEIACNDNLCSVQSRVTVDVIGGQTYLLRVGGDGAATGFFTLEATTFDPGSVGPDVTLMDIQSLAHYGPVGNIHAYAIGSHTCNVGNENMVWDGGTGSPWLAMNAYRISGGRLEQIGLSFCKNACCAAAGSGCGLACNGVGGQLLGVGCLDVYGAGFNGGQFGLGPRSGINAFTGAIAYNNTNSGTEIFKRLQIEQADMTLAIRPDARFFVEGAYVTIDDAPAGKGLNNATYRPVNVSQSTFAMTLTGSAHSTVPGIFAWRDHGLGLGVADNSVEIVETNVPGEGRYYVGARAADNGDGTWRYDYATYNLNSDRSGGSFSVPIPPGTTVTNVGFHDVDYHSGEPYDNTDWSPASLADQVVWTSPETFAQNANSNALRWATMYNFWFDADVPPGLGSVELGLFKPGTPASVSAVVSVPTAPCLCELDGVGGVDVFDLLAYLDLWFDGAAAADLDAVPGVDVFDLLVFLDCWFDASAAGSCV
jgi:hypothetical protein